MAKIRGNDGANTLNGTSNNDEVRGEGGNDLITGFAGADRLRGDKGNDTISGGDGDDRIRGDYGNDLLTGGAGHDRFQFSNQGGSDMVTDFTHGDDVLYISAKGIASMADLTIGSAGDGDAVISFSVNGHITEITLDGVAAASLSASDFLFH